MGGNAARRAFETARTSMTSWLIAPLTGLRWPEAARSIPAMLTTISTHRALKRDRAHPTADVHELVNLFKRAFPNPAPGRFRRYIAVLSDGHPDSRGHHRRCVVDAIAHVKCLRFSRL